MTKAMVLAAGVGSRLDPLSQYIPKPLVPVLNTPVIVRILTLLRENNVTNTIANTHYLSDVLISYLKQHPVEGVDLQFRFEEELSGDAGGVRSCREFLGDGTFIVIMGDLITGANLTKLMEAHKSKSAIATIGVKKMKDVTRFGVMRRDSQGFIKEFQEKPKAEEAISDEISTGIYVLEPEVFNHIPATGVYGFGRQLFPDLVSKGLPVLGEDIGGFWSDIGTLTDLYKANMDALYKRIPVSEPPLRCDRSFVNVQLGSQILIGDNVKIGAGSKIGEGTIIGDNCVIAENASFENCVVLEGSSVSAGEELKNCIYAFDEKIIIDTASLG